MLSNVTRMCYSGLTCTALARLEGGHGRRSLHRRHPQPLLRTFEPDYLEQKSQLPPLYPTTNISLRGYDYHVLESYQSYVHRLCENIGLDVGDGWATPCRTAEVSTYEVGGTNVKETYRLNVYERNVHVTGGLRSVDACLLLDLLRASLPEGVELKVLAHEEAHAEARYIPDPFVEGLKRELTEIEEKKAEEMEESAVKKEAKAVKKKETLLATLEDDEDWDDE